ncbi:hypothetical protein QBC32DRAFT_353302 [Pseudoneurospora amorphoporcata]|uniref:Uncharacterized protein n=1 Tax=Pseudoneurospora amorphoporcata TaxID=241081 RepID=A0AAN6SBR7_9PEZI|nr:hypothetical protein QBC32DRAFT_353302 [Pseudoneurospora amorphoporcata]
MSFTKWFKGGGSGRNDPQESMIFKRSKTKTTIKRSEEEGYYTQDDMGGYVYDNNYHYQPAPGLQPQGYGYSQRMAAKPKKPRLAAQEGHFDAEELTRRLLDVLAEQKVHEVKRHRIREARAAAAAQDPDTQWQQRQEAAISSLNRAPTAADRTTGLRKPSKSYADADIEAAAEKQEYRHVPNNAARALKQTATNKAIRDQDKRAQAQAEHRRQSSELTGEVLIAERTRALTHQTQPQLVLVEKDRLIREQTTDEAPPVGQVRGQASTDKAKRRHSLSLEGALSRISAAWASGAETNQITTAPAPTSAAVGQKQPRESNETEYLTFHYPLADPIPIMTQDHTLPSSSHKARQQEQQPAAAAAAAENNNENDDLSALPSPTTQTQTQSLSQRFRSTPFKKSPSLLNLRQKLGMSNSGSGSGSSGSPGSPATAKSSGSSGNGLEATSPLTAASSCGTTGSAGADNQPLTQPQPGSAKKTATGKSQEKGKEKTRMNTKKSGFFAKLGGSVKKGMF